MTVTCHHCGAPIRSRAALAVGGRTLQPMHVRCFAEYASRQPWHRRPGWPANRWTSFVRFNAVLLLVLLLLVLVDPVALRARWPTVALLLLAANAWLALARCVSWFSIERHLPEA